MKKGLKISIIAIIAVAFLVVAWYLASPLFINKMVNEGLLSQNLSSGQSEILLSGMFQNGDNFHRVSGDAKVISQNNSKYLRFENFDATNGPGLKVYLSNDLNAKDYISLGDLKGNIGDQNYDLSGVDYNSYKYILIWCEPFGVLFGYAILSTS